MFGQSNNPNTPFGGGGFGHQPTNTTPVFGSPNPGQPQPGGLFSSPPPVFGQPQQQSATAFGAPTTNAFGGGGGFGAPPPAAMTGQPGMFGAPAPAPTGFGGGGGAFGAPAPTNAFGSTGGGGGLFGSAPVGGGFGQPAPTGGGLFGQAPAPAFGAAPTSTFGAPPTTSTFGAPSTGLFGAAPTPTTAFGAPSPTAFGAPTGFGAPTPSVFGAPAPSTGFFGGSPAPAPFGAPAPIGGGLFGSTPAPASTGFGGTTSLFGSTPAPTFGSPPAPTTGFGAPGGLFGSTAPVTSVSSGGGGTRIAPYQVTNRQDGTATINLQSISAMEAYKDQSHEELRFADYSQGNRGTASPAPASFGGFGAPAPAPLGGGLFGSSPAPANTFGSTGSSLFGSTPAPAFGAAPAPLGGFGQTTGGSLFGQTPAPASAFGAPAPAFGSPAPAPSGLFGAPAPTGLFGSTPAPAPFGAPAPSGLFGSTPAPSAGFGGGLFGSTPAPSTFGAPASGGLFGAPAPATGGLFGSATPAAPFGQASTFGAPTSSLFGAAPSAAFGAPAPAGYFGQPAPPLPQQFQQTMQPFQVQTAFNAPIVAPGVSEVLELQIRALTNQLDENKKLEVWRGPKAPTSPATTPTSNYNNSESHFFSRNTPADRVAFKTPSSAQIRPRSFVQQEASKPVVSTISTGRDNSSLMSPEAFARSSQLSLVVRPDSLRRLNKLNLHRINVDNPTIQNFPEPSIDPAPTEPIVDHSPLTNGDSSQKIQADNAQDSGKPKALEAIDVPTKSPGYEYYQQVIGTSQRTKNQPIIPAANGTPNGTPRLVPKLTKTGYEVSPTIEEMSFMSEADLASMRNFTVSRPGYASVAWEGSVDVRGANLDEIVVIETKDVSVYTLDEENGTKPDEGTKLNRPALITFEGIFPKEGAYADDDVKSKFELKLKKAVSNMNAEMVAYDRTNGIWKIRVNHFSRYTLVDDEDSDNEKLYKDEEIQEVGATPRPTRFKRDKRDATPYAASKMAVVDMSDNNKEFFRNKSASLIVDQPNTDLRQRAESAATAIRAKLQDSRTLPASNLDTGMDVEYDLDDEQIEEHETSDPLLEQFDVSELLLAHKKAKDCDIFAEYTSKKVCATLMNRSFRVGWHPNGTFLKLSPSSNKLMPTLLITRPILHDGRNDNTSAALLHTQQENAIAQSVGVDGCPLYSLESDAGNSASILSASDEPKHLFLVLSRLLPSSYSEKSTSLYKESVPLDARKNVAVSKFLLNLCSLDEMKANSNANIDVVAEIHGAYSAGNLESASQLATSAGYTTLAVLLACGQACQSDVARLIKDLSLSKELKKALNPTLYRIIENTAGQCKSDIDAFRRGDEMLDWRRRLAIRIGQRPDDTLLEILEEYEASLAAFEAPFPLPSYISGGSSSSTNTKSMLYRILQICSNPTCMRICEALDPSGYTPYLHDFSLPFHLAAAMTSVPDHLFQLTQYDADYIKDGYVAQLIMQGYWEQAVFVLLCCIGHGDYVSTKGSNQNPRDYYTHQAKNLILRFYDEKRDPLAANRRHYLMINVGIPSVWFDEASCYRSAFVDGDLWNCIVSMRAFDVDLWRDAFVSFIWPNRILHRNDGDADKLLSAIDAAILGAAPDSLVHALFRYEIVEKRFLSYRQKNLNDGTIGDEVDCNYTETDELKELQMNMDDMFNIFTTLSASLSSSPSQLLPNLEFLPIMNNSIPLTAMISEILGNITQWKKEIAVM